MQKTVQTVSKTTLTFKITGKTDHHFRCLLSVHPAFRYDTRGEQLVSVSELLEGNAIRETLSADADSFQHPVTAQLLQHQQRRDLACLQSEIMWNYDRFYEKDLIVEA